MARYSAITFVSLIFLLGTYISIPPITFFILQPPCSLPLLLLIHPSFTILLFHSPPPILCLLTPFSQLLTPLNSALPPVSSLFLGPMNKIRQLIHT